MPSIDIRPVAPAYEAQIRALSDETQRVHAGQLPHVFADGGQHQRHLLNAIFAPEAPEHVRGLMALSGDTLMGYVLLILSSAEDAHLPVNPLIADICVVDDFRRQGVATALLTACRDHKDREGWESLRAQVWLGNDASHALFAGAGFDAERTDYRLGSPSVPATPAASPDRKGFWIILALLILAGFAFGALAL